MPDVSSRPDVTTNALVVPPRASPLLAVVDLGSNSFNLLVCEWLQTDLKRVAHCKQIPQLVRGADGNGNLNSKSMQRALRCLHEFRQLLDHHQPDTLDIIGTEALRKAPNAAEFLQQAEAILGATIAIISSEKEAQLAYHGVRFYHQGIADTLLVIDIGGASTELTIGKGNKIRHCHSLQLGCVSLANRFFTTGNRSSPDQKIDACYQHCRREIDASRKQFTKHNRRHTLGASGIMRVIADLLEQSPNRINRSDLDELLQRIASDKTMKDSIPANLRRDVLPAGIVLLSALFDGLGFDQMTVSPGNVKQGLILERLQQLGLQ